MTDQEHTTAPPATEEHARQGQDRHDAPSPPSARQHDFEEPRP